MCGLRSAAKRDETSCCQACVPTRRHNRPQTPTLRSRDPEQLTEVVHTQIRKSHGNLARRFNVHPNGTHGAHGPATATTQERHACKYHRVEHAAREAWNEVSPASCPPRPAPWPEVLAGQRISPCHVCCLSTSKDANAPNGEAQKLCLSASQSSTENRNTRTFLTPAYPHPAPLRNEVDVRGCQKPAIPKVPGAGYTLSRLRGDTLHRPAPQGKKPFLHLTMRLRYE